MVLYGNYFLQETSPSRGDLVKTKKNITFVAKTKP